METSPSRQPWPRPSVGWSIVTLFCVAAILSYTDRQVLSLLVDPIRRDLGISDTQIGVLQGVAFALIYSFAGLPLGRLADIVQRRWVILGGIVAWSLGTILCGYAGSFWSLFGGRIIVGIGEAALAPAALSMIADLFPAERRGIAIGVFIMGMAVGGGVAVTIGGLMLSMAAAGMFHGLPIIGLLAPWRAVLVFLGLCGVPVLLLLCLIREPARRDVGLVESDGQQETLRTVLKQLRSIRSALVPLVLACALMSVGDFAMLSWVPTLLGRRYGISPQEIGLTLGPLIVVASVFASAGGGAISDRVKRRFSRDGRIRLALVCAVLACPFALITIATSSHEVLAAATLWTLFSTCAGLAGITATQEIVPNRARGLSMSFISFGNILLGLGGGATLTGFVTDHLFGDPTAVGHSLTLIILPANLLAILLFHRASRATRSLIQ